MRAIPTPLRSILPLAGLLVLAATNACVIINGDGDDDDDQCVDLTEVCPNLSCEFGNVVVDGCAICECNTACDPGPAPECAFPVLIEEECRWECGAGECFFDEDCGPGFVCVKPGTETPDGDQADPPEGGDAFPAPDGVCVAIQNGCFSDADCGDGFFCDFSGNGVDREAPPPPDNGGAEPEPQPDPVPPPPEGQCLPLPTECFSDVDCPEGQVCEFPDFTNGLVAPGGVCVVPTPVSECEVDTDCAEGQVCAIECRSDPNCPECDVCLFFGTCVTPEQPCFADEECADGEFCDFGGAARPCLDADGDGLCDDGNDLIAPQGVCRPLEEPNPCAAVLCLEGTTCVVENGEAKCIATEPLCAGDAECGEGLVCNAADICLPPPDCDPSLDRPCVDLCYGFCVAPVVSCFGDADCDRGEICVFDGGIDAGGGANRPIIAPQGTCQPAPTTCDADVGCAEGEICLNGQCTIDPNTDPCATVRCSAGTTCQVNAAGNAECVPDAAVCASDADCANGGRCNAGIDVCNPPPDCQPGEACADVCFGFCQ